MEHRYEISGIVLASSVPLPSLRGAAARAAPDVAFVVHAPSPPPPVTDWAMDRIAEGASAPSLSIARRDEEYLLRAHGFADFSLDRRGRRIDCTPHEALDASTLEQLLADQILPQVLHLLGRRSFHASAVVLRGGQVVAFMGRSGAGKSTLAAGIGGESLVSDDCLAVESSETSVVVRASYASVRLCEDAAAALFPEGPFPQVSARMAWKRRIARSAPEAAELRLAAVYLLEEGEGAPRVVPLGRRDAVLELARHLYRLDCDDRVELAAELDLLERIAQRVPVARLRYRRRFEDLPLVSAAIESHLALLCRFVSTSGSG